MTTPERLWERYPELVQRVQEDHHKQRDVAYRGHEFEHAFAVAQYAQMIAEDRRVGVLGWIAGLCHNTDRIYLSITEEGIREKLQGYLSLSDLGERDKERVVEAVLEHSKLNDPKDNPVTVVLKDADRLGNIGALVCLRGAQHYSHLPAVDYANLYANPEANFKNPLSIAMDLHYSLEWEPWLRMPKAKNLAAPKFKFLREFLKEIEAELREVWLHPYPFPVTVQGGCSGKTTQASVPGDVTGQFGPQTPELLQGPHM